MSEATFQAKIIKHLADTGWYPIKLIRTNKNGIPDIVAVKKDRTIFIEVKSKTGKLSKIQEYRHQELKKLGLEVMTIKEGEEICISN